MSDPAHIIDRYELLDELGSGGMGTTWKARDTETGALVALKLLDLRRLDDWKSVELFERESRVLQSLDHPGIPSYVHHFETDADGAPAYGLVQELAPGTTLAARIAEGWRPAEDEIRDVAEQLLDILSYLQQLSPPVVHRDIKPENVLIDEHGNVSLVDFGSVRDTYRDTIGGGSTVVGTFGYMAPEQFRGHADATTDLYGLGATLLFLLTRESPSELPQERMTFSLDRLRCSPALRRWVASLVEPMTEDRPAGPAEALTLLHSPAPTTDPSPAASKLLVRASRSRSPLLADAELPPGNIFFGAPTTLEREIDWAREIHDEELEQVLEVLQGQYRATGTVQQVGRRTVWGTMMQRSGRDVSVAITRRSGRTELVARERLGNMAGGLFGGIGGGVGGGVGGGLAYFAFEVAGAMGVVAWILMVTLAALGIARAAFVSIAKRRNRQLAGLEQRLQAALSTADHDDRAHGVDDLDEEETDVVEQIEQIA